MLVVNARLCTGCRTCEIACAFAHGTPGAFGAPRVRVAADRTLHVPVLCLQCDDAACVRVCPTRALGRNARTGAIECASSRCIRCGQCAIACSFGNITVTATGETQKCDLCGGQPACARFCPSGALKY